MQMDRHVIDIAQDFSRSPAGRFISDGPNSGERLRNMLADLLRGGEEIELRLDGTRGYGSSFLDAAFGGLVRICGFDPAVLRNRIRIVTDDPSLAIEIKGYWAA